MAQEIHSPWFDQITYIWGGAVGGLVVMLLGNRLRASHDATIKRQRFRNFVSDIRRRISSKSHDEFVYLRQNMEIAELEREAFEIKHFIQPRLLSRFERALESYKAVSFDAWAGPDAPRQKARDDTNEKSKKDMIRFLDEIWRCAWWAV
jgi:hypothetical protein